MTIEIDIPDYFMITPSPWILPTALITFLSIAGLYVILSIASDKVFEMKIRKRAIFMDKFWIFTSASLLGGFIIAISHTVLMVSLAMLGSTEIIILSTLQLPSFLGCLITNILYGLRIEKRKLNRATNNQTKMLLGGLISLITVVVGTLFFTFIIYGFLFLQTFHIPGYYLAQLWSVSQIALNIFTFFTQNVVGGLIGGIVAFVILYLKETNRFVRREPSKTLKTV
jgi:hypothetical protein